MNSKDLAKKIQYIYNCYRKGEAKISDPEYDCLFKELKNKIQIIRLCWSMKLIRIRNYCFSKWSAEKTKRETMAVQHKTRSLNFIG
mgnify:CR=1 FL=1